EIWISQALIMYFTSLRLCTLNLDVQKEIVDQHNDFRRNVQPTAADMLKMSYSKEVGHSAQSWVNRCLLKHGPVMSRMINGYQMGENLFYSSYYLSWTDVIKAWHSEVEHYKFPIGSINGQPTGHYTQMVWKGSYKIGCGVKLCGEVFLYGCQYYRAGNFRFWNPYTVGPSCQACPNDCEDRLCTNPCPHINNNVYCPLKALDKVCSNEQFKMCPASCSCKTEIIPIG
uniref:Cysteine-rich venom protein-like n=1 Tax=Cynoglossus semilaevis TaxID=244447 RepID=A0A3P8UW95_CYNSE